MQGRGRGVVCRSLPEWYVAEVKSSSKQQDATVFMFMRFILASTVDMRVILDQICRIEIISCIPVPRKYLVFIVMKRSNLLRCLKYTLALWSIVGKLIHTSVYTKAAT